MDIKQVYCSYDDYSIIYDLQNNTFSISAKGRQDVVKSAQLLLVSSSDKRVYPLSCYKRCTFKRDLKIDNNVLIIEYSESDIFESISRLEFKLNSLGVHLTIFGLRENSSIITGELEWGANPVHDTFAMCLDRSGFDLRAGIGPATSSIDNVLYDRQSDAAFCIEGGKKIRLKYDWGKTAYTFELKTGLVEFQQRFMFTVKEHVIAEKYGINYAPVNKMSTFSKPPAGWMTWYAVKFDASEKTVMENVLWQKENLKSFGADAIWIDWEWYHQDFKGERDDGVNTFSPDLNKYPHGLKYISEQIKKAGFVPALWIGFTNDSSHNEYTKQNPEIILAEKIGWCGKYFYDFSHPKYLNDFLPKALKQVHDWGYEAIKFDTLPIAIDYHEEFHMNMYDPTLTTKAAFRQAMQKTREILGENLYMLSCAAVKDADILWAADIFDAGRVGNDIFEWKDFIKEGVMNTLKFYSLHNIVLYADPDNIILREAFNTYEQAASRVYFTAILGLPMTFGDFLPELSDERVDLLKRCLPVMDIHPMDIKKPINDTTSLTINLSIEKSYESYNVVDVFNLTHQSLTKKINIDHDLHLEETDYLVFDFTDRQLKCIVSDFIYVELKPCESRLLCLRRREKRPQLLSTTRHIIQGAAEIKNMHWNDEDLTLHISANLVKDDLYEIYLYVPEGYTVENAENLSVEKTQEQVYKFSFMPSENIDYDFCIRFGLNQ